MTSSRMFLVFYTTILISFCSVGVSINEDLHVGPCVVRRMKLPRLDPVMVGYVRQVELLKNEELFEVKTLSLKPPIFVTPDENDSCCF